MPKKTKMTGGRLTVMLLTYFWILALLAIGANNVFNLDFNDILVSVIYIAGGLWLIAQGGFKAIKAAQKKPNIANLLHIVAFAFGLLFIYVGLIGLPGFGALSLDVVAKFTGWITFIGAVVAGVEVWV